MWMERVMVAGRGPISAQYGRAGRCGGRRRGGRRREVPQVRRCLRPSEASPRSGADEMADGALEGLGLPKAPVRVTCWPEKSKGASSIHKRRMTVQARRGRHGRAES